MLAGLWQDLRLALRQLRRAPAFTLAAIVTLALGTGINTGVFSIISGFLRPLPVPAADRLVVLAASRPGDTAGFRYFLSYPALVDYRQQAQSFSDLVGWDVLLGGLSADGKTTKFIYANVTGNFFSGLGLTPARGRFFQPRDVEGVGADALIVLSHGFWMTQFGGRDEVIGSIVRLNGVPTEVIGVAPEQFRGPYGVIDIQGYMLLGSALLDPERPVHFNDRAFAYLTIIGRMKPGVTVDEAQADVDVVARRLEAAHPATDKGTRIRVLAEPLARPIPVPFVSSTLPLVRSLLFALSGVVLLLSCLNVANLLLVRATVRQHELAIRAALGSGRARLIRMLMIEAFVLAAAGAALGAFLGQWMTFIPLQAAGVSGDLTFTIDASYDWRVFAYAVGTALAAGLVLGLVPALRASRAHAGTVLRDGDRTGSAGPRRWVVRHALVAMQIAGSIVILVVAGFFMRSLQRSAGIDVGFDPAGIVTMAMDPKHVGYGREQSERFYGTLVDRVREVPGVEHAALSFTVPMGYIFGSCPIQAESAPLTHEREWPAASYNTVGTGYFDTLRLPIVEGRAFDDRDTTSSTPVAIVNETLAASLWPDSHAIGKRLRAACSSEGTLWEVVGIARNSKYVAPFESPLPHVYLFLPQLQPTLRVLQIRTMLPTGEMAARVKHEVARIDPAVEIFDVRTMAQVISGAPTSVMFRVGAIQAVTMGLVALTLAMVGLYGVVSYGASQRVREIGIRLALGADRSDVRRLILGHASGMVAAGVGLGLIVSAAVTLVATRFLVVVSAADPVTFGSVTAILVVVALLACYLPARRAMRIDPATALRRE